VPEYPVESFRDTAPPRRAHDFGYAEGPSGKWEEEEESGLDLRRIFTAVVRRKWLVLILTMVGAAVAAMAWTQTSVRYTAQGSIWVDTEDRTTPAEVSPIRQPGLFETSAYIELFRSASVLLPVVEEFGLFLEVADEYRPLLDGLDLEEQFQAGSYTLTVAEGGAWNLEHAALGTLDSGDSGEPMGEDLGIRFSPRLRGIEAGTEIGFQLIQPFRAQNRLAGSLVPTVPGGANFIRVAYSGTDPERTTAILNAVLERHVEVAADLKRGRLDETQEVLESQLVTAEDLLARAEGALESFRVQTVVLPSDQATPISPGLELTRGPVFDNFFEMQTQLEEVRRDRARIVAVLDQLPGEGAPVESLEGIPAASNSRELEQVLDELVTLRGDLRLLRQRYSDEYPPIRDLLEQIQTLTGQTIPRILQGLVRELSDREARLTSMIDDASNELSEIPVRTIEEQRLRRQVQIQENLYNDLRSRVENTRLAAASSVPDVRLLDRAVVPVVPSEDPRILLAGFAILGGLGLGLVGAILLDRFDGRLRYPTQVDSEMGLNILGTVPRVKNPGGLRKRTENHSAVLEAFRELRIAISFAFGSAGPLTFVVTSPSEGEGKTFVSTNLAVAFADLGRRTVLVDGDTRRGDAHRMLGVARTPGLTDFLANGSTADVVRSTDYPNLSLVPCGTRGGSTPELLASPQMAEFLGTLKSSYDVVIVDSPPLTGGGDALVLSNLTGNLAMVLRAGSTERTLAADRVEALARFPFRLLGAILNDTDPSGFYGYYPTYLPSYLTDVDSADALESGGRLVLPGARDRKSDGKSDD